MSDTPLLALPLLEASQAQKHVTHNEALLLLDAMVHLAAISRALAAPPASPGDGDRYLVAASATGDCLHAGAEDQARPPGAHSPRQERWNEDKPRVAGRHQGQGHGEHEESPHQ